MSWSRLLTVNIQANPVLAWEWSVFTLPTAAAIRPSPPGDHWAALYVMFLPREARSRKTILEYIWDNARPLRTVFVCPKDPSVHDVVVRSGPSRLGR